MDLAFEIPQLSRTEEYDDPSTFLMPDPSWLVRTTADMGERNTEESISDEAYWADVFGNNWYTMDEDAAYWADIFGDLGQLDYDEVYNLLLE